MTNQTIIALKIALEDTEPEIWRRVEVSAAVTLKQLHVVIQAAMDWEDDHLYQFERGRDKLNAGRTTLADLLAGRVKRLTYVYDFGDDWRHDIRIEKAFAAPPGTTYPRLVDGAGQSPPEDVGGIPGFYASLDALADPNHPDHDLMLDWYGGPFDPAAFDRDRIDKNLASVAEYLARKAKRA